MRNYFGSRWARTYAAMATVMYLTGCAGANISTQIRESGETGSNMMLRCADLKTLNEPKMNEELQQFDGWKLVYISEYTTGNRIASAVHMCFEKPYSKSAQEQFSSTSSTVESSGSNRFSNKRKRK